MSAEHEEPLSNPSPGPSELAEDLRAREEAAQWDLRGCPVCGVNPRVLQAGKSVTIACPHKRHKIVSAATLSAATAIWNEGRFTKASL